MTEKLYYSDSEQFSFRAVVTAVGEDKKGRYVVLDRTLFYPEGGGQPYDQGRLGSAFVRAVHEVDGEIRHYIEGAEILADTGAVGQEVEGLVDEARRRDLMQQHSGEHIVSGMICRRFGCDNVGFHISEDFVTIDFNTGMTPEELLQIEEAANAYVRACVPVRIFVPSPEELAALEYRSKKALEGDVRIVDWPGADRCACCGTHVKNSGEIGLIKLVHLQNHRGGVRIEMLCGGRALRYVTQILAQNSRVSTLFSAKELETAAAAEKLLAENQKLRQRAAILETAAIETKAHALAGAGDVLLWEEGMESEAVRRLCDAVMNVCGGLCAVVSDCGEDGLRYALGQPGGDLREAVKALNAALNGRGGGKPFFVQGTWHASKNAAAAALREHFPTLQER